MFYQLPPAGNPICSKQDEDVKLPPFLSSRQTRFYNSGTAALAATVKVAISTKPVNSDKAEVILPAYACPDLISAVVHAGARPVLVDLECERPWLDLNQLADALIDNTVAIIAVNLFGISERWDQIRAIAETAGVLLIEDSAQYFPGGVEKPVWHGDLIVFSFGRGKPVSLLGGGAVMCRRKPLFAALPEPEVRAVGWKDMLVYKLKAGLYNVMISPVFYWLPQALPFLHLGETRYHTLHDIEAMDAVRSKLLATNIASYQDDIKAVKRCELISSAIESRGDIVDLPKVCDTSPSHRLLRYPVLIDAKERDTVYQKLKLAGLGASLMYPASLPEIPGLTDILDDEIRFPNAENFAASLLTLPTHSHVNEKDIEKMSVILKEF